MATRVRSVKEIQAKLEGRPPPPPEPVPVDVAKLQDEVNRLRLLTQRRPTKSQLLDDLREIFKKYEVHPVEELIKLVKNEPLSPDQRIKVWSELASYVTPKLKSTEVTGQVDMNFTVVVRKFGEPLLTDEQGRLSSGEEIGPTITVPVESIDKSEAEEASSEELSNNKWSDGE